VIKNTCLNPDFYKDRGQISRVSLLLYGPAGTGKSTFAYRIAMCLSRHLMSLDLRGLGKSKLYQILQKPTINETAYIPYKEVVFLFEEFDVSIKELYLRDKKISLNTDLHYSKMFSVFDKIDKNIGNDGEYNETVDQTNTKIQNTLKTTQYDLESENEFKLRDLLEIFQGPCPFESMIIIANTNKYDEIKNMCPELFRPGRITPVYFGYINKETLQDISKFYFGKKLTGYIPDVLSIPTSQIIEVAFESLLFAKDSNLDPYVYFSDQMNKLMH
jgi:SpoVK/Ycf46/Vps4 family AAA+-type ATPase